MDRGSDYDEYAREDHTHYHLPTEVDNHADTICAGANCFIESYTGEQCSVSPFLDDYAEVDNVRVCTAITAVMLPNSGETVLLRMGQCLDFHDKMQKTLLNPNQIRHHGLELCDDPTDPNRNLGILLDDKTFLPFSMDGTICSVMTWFPTNDELQSCRVFTISDENNWDPACVQFNDNAHFKMSRHPAVSSVRRYSIDMPVNQSWCESMAEEDLLPTFESLQIYSTISSARHHSVSAESLAYKWECSIETAKATLDATTQLNLRSAVAPLTRGYRTDLLSQRLRRLDCKFFTDTLFAKVKSLSGNSCAQLYYDPNGFMYVYPMMSKGQAGESLDIFVNDVGIPNRLTYDGAAEQVKRGTRFHESIRHYRINDHVIEPYSPWQNRAESGIRILKSKWKRMMIKRQVPKRLWDFALVWICQVYSRSATKSGRTGYEIITGDTPDISEWLDFTFYDWVWYWHPPDANSNPHVGRWLGVSHRVGSALCYWILTSSGNIVARTTVQHLTEEELKLDETKSKLDQYNASIQRFLGDDGYITDMDGFAHFINDDEPDQYEDQGQDSADIYPPSIPEIDDVVDNGDAEKAADTYHSYIGAEVVVPDAAGVRRMARVVKQVDNGLSTPSQQPNNPLLDTSVFEVEFPDGTIDRLNANVIAENLMSQTDPYGHHYMVLREIVEHRKDGTAITVEDGFIRSKSGNVHPKKTTRGWKLLVEWKDGSSEWVPLKDLKASNLLELAEYAVANNLEHEPAFKWWVKTTLRARDRIIGKVKSRYWRTTHKFGFRIPKTVEEAYEIDRETGTNFWQKAIEKELGKVRVAFEILGVSPDEMRSGKVKPGYQEIKCHWVFDIKMDGNFTRKARLVAGGHTTETPSSLTYSSVVSRDSVRLAFLIAALNDLDIMCADVGNAYLNAPCREKIWTVAGIEFGSEAGSTMVIVRALYGLKTSGASWAAMLAESLAGMGYKPTEADRNVWIKASTKPDGFKYYQMILVYVDDILHLSHDPKPAIEALQKLYVLKDESIGSPKRYLFANIDRVQTQDGRNIWSMSSESYVRAAIENVENMLKSDGSPPLKVYGDCKRPYPSSYRPEIDVSEELNPDGVQRYQELIGILRWAIELGRLDIMTEVSCLSQHMCEPRVGHLDAVYNIFRYLQRNMNKNKGRIGFDPVIPFIDPMLFSNSSQNLEHWKDFYPDAQEPIPNNMPEPLGNPVDTSAYVDANHAGNLANRRSHSGILIYVNNSPILWYSKRQNTVESSSFGSEFVALRIATEMIEALRYKLRMFGVPLIGPTNVFCDNKSVVTNASVPSSVLNKRHNAICYHRVREAQAAGTIRVAWIPGTENLADLFTKTTLSGNIKNDIVETIFCNNAAVVDRA